MTPTGYTQYSPYGVEDGLHMTAMAGMELCTIRIRGGITESSLPIQPDIFCWLLGPFVQIWLSPLNQEERTPELSLSLTNLSIQGCSGVSRDRWAKKKPHVVHNKAVEKNCNSVLDMCIRSTRGVGSTQ